MAGAILIVLAVLVLALLAAAILYVVGIRSRAQRCELRPVASTTR